MPNDINYKSKYLGLRMKFMGAVDTAFRTGYEQGMKDGAQQEQQMQQQQSQQLEMAQAQGQAQPGQPGAGSGAAPGQAQPESPYAVEAAASENPQGTELDQHIAKLESMLGQSEGVDKTALAKAVSDLKFAIEMKKSSEAIPAIAKALHKPSFKFATNATHNLSNSAKSAVTMQHKIVTDIMKGWEEEEKKASKDIASILSVEGLTKKE